MRLILLILIITSFAFGQYTNWEDKTASQLSGITSGSTNIASKSYWTSNAYAQLKVLFDLVGDLAIEATDTTSLKAMPADTSLKIVYLSQSGLEGWFVKIDSAYSETGDNNYFNCATTGKQWASYESYIVAASLANTVADTTTLKAYNPTTAGTFVNLKQLASGNSLGGGIFIYRSSGTADHVLTFAASGGGVWERVEAQYNWVDPKWAGAKGDGTTDDYTALQRAINVAKDTSNNKILLLNKGTYRYSQELDLTISSPLPSTTSRRNFQIQGVGIGRSVLLPDAGVVGLRFKQAGANRYYNPVIRDISVMGTAQADTGIVINQVNQPILENVQVDSFRIGYWIYNSEAGSFIGCKALYCVYGGYMTSNSNGNTFLGWSAGFCDSTGFFAESCAGLTFLNADQGNHPIGWEFGAAANVTIEATNSESCDSAHVIVGTSANVTLKHFRALGGSCTYWLYVLGGGICTLENSSGSGGSITNAGIWVQHSSRAYLFDRTVQTLPTKKKLVTYSTWGDSIAATNFDGMVPAYAPTSFVSASNSRGKLIYTFRRANSVDVSTSQEALLFGQEIDTNTVVFNWLTDGNDWRFSTDGNPNNTATRYNLMRMYHGSINFTSTSGTHDSTIVTIKTDTLGIQGIKAVIPGAVSKRSAGDMVNGYATYNRSASSTANGTISFTVWHPSPSNTGDLALTLDYLIIVQAKTLGKW